MLFYTLKITFFGYQTKQFIYPFLKITPFLTFVGLRRRLTLICLCQFSLGIKFGTKIAQYELR